MTPSEAMKEIEHLKFAVHVGLANSFRAFLRNISNEHSVKQLLASAKTRDVAQQVLQRVLSLSKMGVDFRYLNRFDIPLATYLWILSRAHPDLSTAGAEATAHLPRTWWTEQVSRYILEEFSKKSDTSTNVFISGYQATDFQNVNTSNVAASTARFLPEPLFDSVSADKSVRVSTSTGENYVFLDSDLGQNALSSFDTAQSVFVKIQNQ